MSVNKGLFTRIPGSNARFRPVFAPYLPVRSTRTPLAVFLCLLGCWTGFLERLLRCRLFVTDRGMVNCPVEELLQ